MKAGYIQNLPEFGNIKKNLETVYDQLSKINNTLIVLPELFATGYNFQDISEVKALSFEYGKDILFDALSHISKKNNLTIVFGYAEKCHDKFFNSAAIIENGTPVNNYRKTHLFNKENLFFSKGDTGFSIHTMNNGAKIGTMICFDWIFPESSRTLSLMGADIICHCTNLVLPFCPDATITRCVENHVITILSNRTGIENRGNDNFRFIGKSEIVMLDGKIVNRSSEDKSEIFIAEIDHTLSRNKTLNPFNDLFQDRRTDMYK